jgi:hypothetical protein
MDYVTNNLISGPMRKTTECIGFQPSWAPIWHQGAQRRAAECSPDFRPDTILRSNHLGPGPGQPDSAPSGTRAGTERK